MDESIRNPQEPEDSIEVQNPFSQSSVTHGNSQNISEMEAVEGDRILNLLTNNAPLSPTIQDTDESNRNIAESENRIAGSEDNTIYLLASFVTFSQVSAIWKKIKL